MVGRRRGGAVGGLSIAEHSIDELSTGGRHSPKSDDQASRAIGRFRDVSGDDPLGDEQLLPGRQQ